MDFNVRVLPELSSIIIQLISTLVLFLVLRHFLFGPVSKFLKERQNKIENNINEAKKNKEEAVNLKKDYEIKIIEAKDEAKGIVESARKRGEELRDEIVKDAKKEANSLIEKARKEIDREKAKATDDLKKEVSNIAIMVASKIIDKELDQKAHNDMISKFIDEVGESRWQN